MQGLSTGSSLQLPLHRGSSTQLRRSSSEGLCMVAVPARHVGAKEQDSADLGVFAAALKLAIDDRRRVDELVTLFEYNGRVHVEDHEVYTGQGASDQRRCMHCGLCLAELSPSAPIFGRLCFASPRGVRALSLHRRLFGGQSVRAARSQRRHAFAAPHSEQVAVEAFIPPSLPFSSCQFCGAAIFCHSHGHYSNGNSCRVRIFSGSLCWLFAIPG
eukprot:3105532-Pleurochrysis_carterae.AAC.1